MRIWLFPLLGLLILFCNMNDTVLAQSRTKQEPSVAASEQGCVVTQGPTIDVTDEIKAAQEASEERSRQFLESETQKNKQNDFQGLNSGC